MAISFEQNIKNAFIWIKWEATKKKVFFIYILYQRIVDTTIPNVTLLPLTMHSKIILDSVWIYAYAESNVTMIL